MEEPYQTEAYKEVPHAQNRFLNLTYLSGNSKQLILRQQQQHKAQQQRGQGGLSLVRGVSLGNIVSSSTSDEFDTQKIASHDTLRRLKLTKADTDPNFALPTNSAEKVDVSIKEDDDTKDSQCGEKFHDFLTKIKN